MNDPNMEPHVGHGDVLDVAGFDRRGRDLDERPLEALSDWLAAGRVDATSTLPRRKSGEGILPMRLMVNRLHTLADDTELRARTLAWMIEARGFTERSARKVETLFRIAAELRQMAERVLTAEEAGRTPLLPSSGDVRLTRGGDTLS